MDMRELQAQFEAEIDAFTSGQQREAERREAEAIQARLDAGEEYQPPHRKWAVRERREVFREKGRQRVAKDMRQPEKRYRKKKGVAGKRRMDGQDQHGEVIQWSAEKIAEVYGV